MWAVVKSITPGIAEGYRLEAPSGFEPEYTDLQSAA